MRLGQRGFAPFLLALVLLLPLTHAWAESRLLTAPDGTEVVLRRDAYGVPHISGQTEVGVYFGQGFAVAEDRLYQLEIFRRCSEGKLAEWLGASFLPLDQEVRQMMYTPAERTAAFDALPLTARMMYEAFSAGVNGYLDSMAVDPGRLLPYELAERTMEPWTVEKSIAVSQFITGAFGQYGGFELTRLSELQSHGREWFDKNRPINDPSAPTTIHGDGVCWANPAAPYSGPAVRRGAADDLVERRDLWRGLARRAGLPPKFGSFAVLIGAAQSATGNPLLLGAPQMGGPRLDATNCVHEVELDCPTLHVAGMALAGMPGIIIGRNAHLTWSLTSGYSDNSDIFIDSTESASFTRYRHNGRWVEFESYADTIFVNARPTIFTHYRTLHGPVVGEDLERHQVYSLAMTFRREELEMPLSLDAMSRARTLEEFEQALTLNPMSFNVFCATDEGRTGYWHIGKYQDRLDGVDPRLPHRGDGSQEWQGFLPFSALPRATDSTQAAFCNWNNKPASWWDQGDNMPWIGNDHVTAIAARIEPAPLVSFEQLGSLPRAIGDHGTYQQVLEVRADRWRAASVAPPGQSAFIDLRRQPSPHVADQWPLHKNWQFKALEFGPPELFTPPLLPDGPAEIRLSQAQANPFAADSFAGFAQPDALRRARPAHRPALAIMTALGLMLK